MKQNQNPRLSAAAYICYFGLYLIITVSLLIRQPFGSPPDEFNRYLIPQFIAEHGTLPNGYDESIRIGGYGFSYAFQPILPYIIQGWTMRLVGLFTESETALLYAARSVNLLFGLVMAAVVLLLGYKWFQDRRFSWLFAFLVTFLPQGIFMHTYVNTDSCCMMSTAIMLYGLTCGLQEGFSRRASAVLAAGIIFCALSYYNAYGYILSCILLFTAYYLTRDKGNHHFNWKQFLKAGSFISVLVLAGISWWFIRSAVLYDGDFLGLKARDHCASLYAALELRPENRITWKSQGYSVLDMLTKSAFLELSRMSFIGIFGAMSIPTSPWVYRFYRILLAGGVLSCVIIPFGRTKLEGRLFEERKGLRAFFHGNMIFCMLMPLILSIQYSYATDYQPQGRYLLPILVPLGLYCVRGVEKLLGMKVWGKFGGWRKLEERGIVTVAVAVLVMLILACVLVSVYGYVFEYYAANPGAQ